MEPNRYVRQFRERLQDLLHKGPSDPLDRGARFLVYQVRLWWFCGRKMVHDRMPMVASALAYKTLVSMIPVLVIIVLIMNALIQDRDTRQEAKDFIFRLLNLDRISYQPLEVAPLERERLDRPWRHPNGPAMRAGGGAASDQSAAALTNQPATASTDQSAAAWADPSATATGEPGRTVIAAPEDAQEAQTVKAWISRIIDRAERTGPRSERASTPLTVISIAVLVLAGMSIFSTVEGAFNYIWEVPQSRSWLVRLRDFAATMVIVSLFLGVTIWGGRALSTQVQFGTLMTIIGGLVPLATTWFVLFIVYKLLPNTKVNTSAALVAALGCGILWEFGAKLGIVLYLKYATGAARLYGNLALIPILMLWIWITWMVILFGAELSYVIQHMKLLTRAQLDESRRNRFLRPDLVGLLLAIIVGRRFQEGAEPPTVDELADSIGAGESDIKRIMTALRNGGLVRVAECASGVTGYQPARPLSDISAEDVVEAVAAVELSPGNGETSADLFRWVRGFIDETAGGLAEKLRRESIESLARRAENVAGRPGRESGKN